MPDTFSVTGSFDKASYSPGNTITGTISGGDVLTVTTTTQINVGPVTVPIQAADGAKFQVVFPVVTVSNTVTTSTPESVVIDTTLPIVDNGPSPRAWTVSADKLHITAIA